MAPERVANADPPAEPAIVQVCGRLVVRLGDRRVEGLLPGRQGRVLFVFLTVNRMRDSTTDQLIGALWPDEAPAGSEQTLRSLVSKIRRAVGSGALGRGGRYRLELPPGARVDLESALDAVHRAESAVQSGDWRRAWGPAQVALFTARRGFLPEEDAPWVQEQRRTLDEVELRALECYAAASLGIGGVELPGAERTARRLVEREPFRESGYRILMQALAEGGNVAAALQTYDKLSGLLREELGVSPSPPTQELHAQLLAAT